MRYRFIQAHQGEHRLRQLCQTLDVSRSGYYAWRRRPASARTRANACLLEQMQQLHRQTKHRYGAVKLWRARLASGVACGRHRVARLRRLHGLEAHRTRRFRVVVEQHPFAPAAPNRLQQVFVAPAVNRIWGGRSHGHRDSERLAVSGGAARPVLAPRDWLGDERQARSTGGPCGVAHGARDSSPAAGPDSSHGSRGYVHEHGLPTATDRTRHRGKYESKGQLL